MLNPKVYVRCDTLEVKDIQIETFGEPINEAEYEGLFTTDTIERFDDEYYIFQLTFLMYYQDKEGTIKIKLKKPYIFTYTMEKFNRYGAEEIKTSAVNEILYEINDFLGSYMSLITHHRVQLVKKGMN